MTLARRVVVLEQRLPIRAIDRSTAAERRREVRAMLDAIFGHEGSEVYDRNPEPAPDFGGRCTPAERDAAAKATLDEVFGQEGGDG